MFFFFIGGIQPKTVVVDSNPRICPECGLSGAVLKRTDHYLSIFFIPLFRVKKGETYLECPRCGPIIERGGYRKEEAVVPVCPHCKKEVSPEYRYCPFCGRRLK
jgi:predicted RNA-binding Zn-ribbon protein involved in translation (DUF1610 family)